ncbi:MAG: diacylglycerol kinase [Herpetosiphonaceae bacterium]|nr:MAG: diacylglycerol kinase [Herpetosiphonaceae bacterium]
MIERFAGRQDGMIYETSSAGHARQLAQAAAQAGCDLVIAVGGDGTINEVVNGLAVNLAGVTLGIIPLGTGNDLARTLAIPLDPVEALDVIEQRRERRIDLINVKSYETNTYCVNVAAGGFSGQVDEVLNEDIKATWGPLAYLVSAASVLPDLTGYETTVAYEDEAPRRVDALSIIVANGRTAGGGLRVAPQANPEDGLLDVVIVRYSSLLNLAGVAARLLAGNYLDSDVVVHKQVRRLSIASRPGMWFNIDGELLTKEPVIFAVQPQALRVLVGPDYMPTPAA